MSAITASLITALAGALAVAVQVVRLAKLRRQLTIKTHEHEEEVRAHTATKHLFDIATIELERAKRSCDRRIEAANNERDFALRLLDGVGDSDEGRALLRARRERLSLPLDADADTDGSGD